MSEPEPTAQELDAEHDWKCDRSITCPTSVRLELAKWISKRNAGTELEGTASGFANSHDRLHELSKELTMFDDGETFSWGSTLRLLIQEVKQHEEDERREEKGRLWKIEEGKAVLWTPRGISLRVERNGEAMDWPVITGYFKPVRSVFVEGWTYYEVWLSPTESIVGSFEDIFKRMRREGRIRKKKLGEDVLVEVIHGMSVAAGTRFPTFGLYSDGGPQLSLVLEPVPVKTTQQEAAELIAPALVYEPNAGDLEVYFRIAERFRPYESSPAMGLSAICPAAQLLRSLDVFVPHLFHYSHAHGVGKSNLAMVFSTQVWGRAVETGNTLNSEFRIPAILDAAATPVTVDESEHIDFRRFGATIKASCERPIVTRRGNTVLDLIPYGSRGILYFTGNQLPPRSGALLTRFLAPRFDLGSLAERKEHKKEYDELRARTKPVGGLLARALLEEFPTVEELLSAVRDHEHRILREGGAAGFQDVRRPQMWAVVYLGLKVWARAAKRLDVAWEPPSVTQFVREVVTPVDAMTFEGRETIVSAFRSWFALWRNRNIGRVTEFRDGGGGRTSYDHREDVRGRGTLFLEGELVVDGKTFRGTWVSKPLADSYNDQAAPDLKIGSLRELAEAGADDAGIPHDLVLDGRGALRRRLGLGDGPQVRCAFIADEEQAQ